LKITRNILLKLLLLVSVVVVSASLVLSQMSFYPTELRRLQLYMFTSPGFLKYCFIGNGTPKDNIIARFGKPTITIASGDVYWRKYVNRRNRAGWSKPPEINCDNILIYEVIDGFDMIVVYYYIDNEKLVDTFISET